MKKEGPANLAKTGHSKGKRSRGNEQEPDLSSLCERIIEIGQRKIVWGKSYLKQQDKGMRGVP